MGMVNAGVAAMLDALSIEKLSRTRGQWERQREGEKEKKRQIERPVLTAEWNKNDYVANKISQSAVFGGGFQ